MRTVNVSAWNLMSFERFPFALTEVQLWEFFNVICSKNVSDIQIKM